VAVPKKRTSRARRDQRRATHSRKVTAPRLNECPRCHSPRLPHRICPTCGTYAGREIITFDVGLSETEPSGTPEA
jgi:large subunit ribosomal protein L32